MIFAQRKLNDNYIHMIFGIMKNCTKNLMILIIALTIPSILKSQENISAVDSTRAKAVKIFLDCNDCDMNYTRQEIPYINYVRDVREAEVFILVTDQDAGSGGEQFTFTFQGQGKFKGLNDTLTYTSSPDQTNTVIREKRTNMLKMGLMRYVAKTPLFNEIEIKHNQELESEEVVDKWNNWVFELSTEPQYESEEANKQLELRNSINISKITPDIKLEFEMDHFFNREKFIENVNTDSATTSTYTTSALMINNLFVKSISDHWSAGLLWDLGSSTRENLNFRSDFLPSIEYDIYPYSEATHRQLRILYSAGVQINNYIDTTVYNKMKETLYGQKLNVAFQLQKKWGSINLLLMGSNYFHDFSKNRIELIGSVRIRIFKGLSIDLNGGVAHINDQLSLNKGDISEAERLLQLRELATKYRVEGGIELTYIFGSIYNNIVNPRFSSSDFHY
ncbi:MAG TPA: hypothetical protein DCZ51_01370 [Bacteroidales bacterium]|nr:hypothetical protein [Bacteroidales bacterium]